MMKQIKTEFEYIGQFNDKSEKSEEAGDISISDLAATMIVEGINPDFVHGMRTTEIADILKAIDAKKKEYIQNNTNEAQKNALLEQKKDLELKNAIEIGVMEVTAIYKDYNHTEMQTFWNKKLNKEE
jgi:hypothetical protein